MRILASIPAIAGILSLAASLLVVADLASAKPTDAQLSAIKANCRSDFMSNCWGVPRGGAEAFQCLKDHMAKLSAGCQQAVKAVIATSTPPANSGAAQTALKPATETKPASTAAAPASPPAEPEKSTPAGSASSSPAAASQSTATAAPTATAGTPSTSTKSTQGTSAGDGSSSGKAAAKKSSTTSATVTSQGSGSAGSAAAKAKVTATQGAETAASAATNAPAVIGFIPPRKKLMVLSNCKQDLGTYCAGVAYGEGRQLKCLFSNEASLSADCRGALARLTQ
jgi:hypothetical protein